MAKVDLSKYGITGTTEIVYNPSYEQLFEEETKPGLEGYEKGQVSELGAVNVMTGPAHILAQDFAILCWVFHDRTAPVLGINEVCTFQRLFLVVLYLGIAYELRIEFVALSSERVLNIM